jgi:hypothetical protein
LQKKGKRNDIIPTCFTYLHLFLIYCLSLALPVLCWIQVAGVGILASHISQKKSFQLSPIASGVTCVFSCLISIVKLSFSHSHYVEGFVHK